MNDVIGSLPRLTLAFIGGVVLGAFFFGGLWWTVRWALASPWVGIWFLASLLTRMTGVVAGVYWSSQGEWQRLVASMAGFLAVRAIALRFGQRPAALAATATTAEVRH